MKKQLFLFTMLVWGFCACHQEKPQNAIVKSPYYQKAESFLYKQNDSAFYYFNRAAGSLKDSLQIAMCYNYMAAIQSDAGDYFGSQESLLLSLKFLNGQDEKNRKCLAADYNELGLTSSHLKNNSTAIDYYNLATRFSDNPKLKMVILNNQANAYQRKKEYTRALKLYQLIYSGTKKEGKEYARILSNMAKTKWLQNQQYNAIPEFLKALKIRESINDLWGQNASFSHLADYYTPSKPDLALFYARAMYRVARQLDSPEDRLEALQKLIILGPPHTTKQYFSLYQHLDDSLQTARNAAKNQFALIRYESEKNKSDNLKLQKDNTETKYQIIKERIFLVSILLVFITIAIASILWYRKRKLQQEQEKQNAIRENQLKTSKKVHDVVANGLYRLMTEVEHKDDVNKEELLDKIELMYEQSRDISYDKPLVAENNFSTMLTDLLSSFSTKTTKVLLVGNSEAFWQVINYQIKKDMEYILQELMVNMTKHSRAGNVVIKFEQKNEQVYIDYTDDGIGLPENFIAGNGFINTGNRIKANNGEFNFEPNGDKGLRIYIAFPIA